MNDAILDKVRERAARHLSVHPDYPPIDAILADVETALVLKAREVYMRDHAFEPNIEPAMLRNMAAQAHPLPTRTVQRLREEPVPGGNADWLLYRWNEGQLQSQGVRGDPWYAAHIEPGDVALMRHALDLHAKPYRKETVPGDERDPWGEGEGEK